MSWQRKAVHFELLPLPKYQPRSLVVDDKSQAVFSYSSCICSWYICLALFLLFIFFNSTPNLHGFFML